jgi:hypothetical protein
MVDGGSSIRPAFAEQSYIVKHEHLLPPKFLSLVFDWGGRDIADTKREIAAAYP